MENFHIFWKNFLIFLKNFQIFWKMFKFFEKCLNFLKNIYIFWGFFGKYVQFCHFFQKLSDFSNFFENTHFPYEFSTNRHKNNLPTPQKNMRFFFSKTLHFFFHHRYQCFRIFNPQNDTRLAYATPKKEFFGWGLGVLDRGSEFFG